MPYTTHCITTIVIKIVNKKSYKKLSNTLSKKNKWFNHTQIKLSLTLVRKSKTARIGVKKEINCCVNIDCYIQCIAY